MSAQSEKDSEALRLRFAGFSYEEIAKRVGYANKGGAWKAVARAQGNGPSGDPVARDLELGRLDMLQRSLMTKALSGDVQAVHAVLKITELRSRLSGLLAPAAAAAAAPVPEVKADPVDDITARIAARRAAAGS